MDNIAKRYQEMMSLDEHELQEIETDASTIDFTQRMKRVIVKKLTEADIPTDKDGVNLLLSTLNSMDRTALGRMKVGVEQSAVDNDARVIDMAMRLRDYEVQPSARQNVRDELPEIDTTALPEREFSDAEKHIGISVESATEFMERFERENPSGVRKT